MTYVHDGTESGTGRIRLNGETVLNPGEYVISHSHRMTPAPSMQNPGAQIRGLGSINGQISSLFPMSLIGKPIELELEDGRRWTCFIQSSDGTLVNSGGISDPERISDQD